MTTHTRRATSLAPNSLRLGFLACAILSGRALAADSYTFTRIIIPGATEVHGQAINNQGDIAGNYIDANGALVGWIRTKHAVTMYHSYGVPGTTEINGINDTGLAWGGYLGTDDIAHGFTLQRGVTTPLDLPGAFATIPIGINNRGFVSGVVVDANGVHGFTRANGVFSVFDYPAAGVDTTLLFGTNDQGQVPGVYFDAQGGHAFLKAGNTLTPVGYPGAAYTQPSSINNRGDIVGHYQTTPGLPPHIPQHGLLVRGGIYSTVNYPGAVATRLFQINDAGVIIGSGLDQGGTTFGFIATPDKQGPK
jgi:hypothetical protein